MDRLRHARVIRTGKASDHTGPAFAHKEQYTAATSRFACTKARPSLVRSGDRLCPRQMPDRKPSSTSHAPGIGTSLPIALRRRDAGWTVPTQPTRKIKKRRGLDSATGIEQEQKFKRATA